MHAQHSYDAILPAPFGHLGIELAQAGVCQLDILPTADAHAVSCAPGSGKTSEPPPGGGKSFLGRAGIRLERPAEDALIHRLATQLAAYFTHPNFCFDVPLAPHGSDFRLRVWRALRDIPAGQVRTYGELARQLGSSARAVGQALGDNPLPILIPCHRVIAAGGGLGGFNHADNGFSIEVKRWLLRHEGML